MRCVEHNGYCCAVPEDRRAKQLDITPAGREIIDSMLAQLPGGLCFGGVSEGEIESATTIMRRLTPATGEDN